jgi:hypothetical protein
VDLAGLPGSDGDLATICFDAVCGPIDYVSAGWWSPAQSFVSADAIAGGPLVGCFASGCTLVTVQPPDPPCRTATYLMGGAVVPGVGTMPAGGWSLVCADGLETASQPPSPITTPPMTSGAEGASLTVRLTVERADGTTREHVATVPFRSVQPNGPQCGPLCWVVLLRFDPGTDALVESPR